MACAIRSNIEADALSPERPLSVWCWRARERERKGGTPSVTRRGAGPSTQHQSKMEAVGGRVWLPTRWALFGFTRARGRSDQNKQITDTITNFSHSSNAKLRAGCTDPFYRSPHDHGTLCQLDRAPAP